MLFGFTYVILFYSSHQHVCGQPSGHLQGAENKTTNIIYHTLTSDILNNYYFLIQLYTIV